MADLADEYQAVLTAAEDDPTLDRALRLVAALAAGEPPRAGITARRLLPRPPTLGRQLGTDTGHVGRTNQVVWAMVKVSAAVRRSLPELPDEQYGLLLDALLVVFHQAYFALLPEAGSDRGRLLEAFEQFAAMLPRTADQCQVLGLVALERGDTAAATNAFRTALAATHSDEHDFITRLQLLWSTLMDRQLWDEAFACLQDVYPRVTRIDLDEVQGLLTQTFADSRHRPSRRRPLAS